MLAYYGFWLAALYLPRPGAGWSRRKFRPDRWPGTGNVAHNA